MQRNKEKAKTKKSILNDVYIVEDIEGAFENAIKKGMKKPEDWMYMYSKNNRDYFKHECTRKYTSYKQRTIMDTVKEIIRKISGKENFENE